jgi:DNA polymerase III delta subunit
MLLIHGDDLVKSRQRLASLIKTSRAEVVRFDGKASLTMIKQALESASLFESERLVVIEGWPSKEVWAYAKGQKKLIIWVGKKVDGRQLIGLKREQVEAYRISPAIFALLDTLKLTAWQRVAIQEPVEKIFFLLARRWRYLIIVKDWGYEGLAELSPFEKSKIVNQAKRYSLEQLLDFYGQLLSVEYSIKSGQTNLPFDLQLEVLLASL